MGSLKVASNSIENIPNLSNIIEDKINKEEKWGKFLINISKILKLSNGLKSRKFYIRDAVNDFSTGVVKFMHNDKRRKLRTNLCENMKTVFDYVLAYLLELYLVEDKDASYDKSFQNLTLMIGIDVEILQNLILLFSPKLLKHINHTDTEYMIKLSESILLALELLKECIENREKYTNRYNT